MDKQFEEQLYYGSNQWLEDMKKTIDNIIEYRKAFVYELYVRVSPNNEVINIEYLSDTDYLKTQAFQQSLRPYISKEYKVFLRKLSDNTITLIAEKKLKSSLELTENFFKF